MMNFEIILTAKYTGIRRELSPYVIEEHGKEKFVQRNLHEVV